MKYVLTKASNYNFMEIVDYDLEQINALALSKGIVITPNYFFNEDNIEKCIDKPSEFCNAIAQIPLEIIIYDDYIE